MAFFSFLLFEVREDDASKMIKIHFKVFNIYVRLIWQVISSESWCNRRATECSTHPFSPCYSLTSPFVARF